MAAPSAERQCLSEIVAALDELRLEQRRLAAAADPAWYAQRAAEDALAAARASIEIAARAAVTHRVSVLAGGDDEPPPSVEDARRAVRSAEDELAATDAARAEIERRSVEVAEAISMRELIVRNRAAEILWTEARPAILTLAAEARAAQMAWLGKAMQIDFLMGLCPPGGLSETDAPLVEARSCARDLGVPPSAWRNAQGGDATAKWRAAFEGLQRDASTKLPR
jgi:hypothetical protein